MKLDQNKIENLLLNQIHELEKHSFLEEPAFLYYKTLLEKIKENLLNKEFRITVVGEFSSGKSTFLNCLIGKDLLPKGVNETTATITYIHNVVPSHQYCDKAIVHYNNSLKSDTIISLQEDENALKEFVSTMSKELNVVEEVKSVHLYTTFKGITENVVLIDTPGSNGTARGHRELAIREIQNAHASLCLFHLRGFGESDLAYVKEISQYQKSIFYVMNFIDEIKKHEGESIETKLEEFKQQINELVYEGKPNNAKVYGISALLGLVSKDHSIRSLYNSDNSLELTLEKREELYSKSMIKSLELDLYSYVNSGDRVRTFYNSIGQKLHTLFSDLYDLFEGKKEIAEVKINKTELDLVSKKLDYFNEKTEANKEKVKTHLSAQQGDLENSAVEALKEGVKDIGNQIKLEVDKETLETLEFNIDNMYNNMVRSEVQALQNKLTTFLQKRLSEINSQIRDHIHEYIPMVVLEKSGELKFVTSADINLTNVELESKKKELNKDLSELNDKIVEKRYVFEKDKHLLQSKKNHVVQEINQKNIKIEENKVFYEIQKRNLGTKPLAQKETIKVKEDRTSLIGRVFIQPLFGKKDVENIIDSNANVNEWIRKFNQITIGYSNTEKILLSNIENIKNKISDTESNLNILDNDIRSLQKKKDHFQKKLDIIKQDSEFYKTNARNEFVKSQRKQIIEKIDDVLMPPSGIIYIELHKASRVNIAENINMIEEVNMKYYDQKVQEYEAKLRAILVNIEGDESTHEVEGLDKNLLSLKERKECFEENILPILN
jgi:hypothetical protein